MNVSLAVPKRIPVTDMRWTVVFFQVAMGGVDTLYHHELTERLAWRPWNRIRDRFGFGEKRRIDLQV